MISWIQRYFQRHFKVVFLLLLAAMAIPMIFIYSASGGLGRASRRRHDVQLFGQSWGSSEEMAALEFKARLSGQLSGNTIAANTEGRAALLYLADKFGVPLPTKEQLVAFIQTRPAFQGPDGKYDPQQYSRIRDMLNANTIGYTEAQVHQVLMEDWRIDHLLTAVTGPGYVADADIKRAFDQSEALWSVQTATLDLTPIKPLAEPTDKELHDWFDIHQANYETPPQVIVDYVEFNPGDYLPDIAQPSDEDIVAYFERNKAKYQKQPEAPGPDGKAPPPVETTLADVRDQVISDMRKARAEAQANGAAADFAALLSRQQITPDSPAFDKLLAQHKLTLKTAPAFSQREWPASLNWNPTIANSAWRLGPANPVSDALRAGENTVVLFYRGKTEAVPATFERARDRVLADVRVEKRRQAIVARGQQLQNKLQSAIASGQSFADAAKPESLDVKSWDKFKISGRPPEGMDYAIFQNLPQQNVHEVSQMSIQSERGTFVYVSDREEPDPKQQADAYASVRHDTMDYAARLAANIAMREMIDKAKLASGLSTDKEMR